MINVKPYIIREKDVIKRAIKMLQKNDIKILTVINLNQKLCGTITDGDIRRGLIKGKTIDNHCHEIMNKKPSYALIGDDIKTVEFGWPIGMPVCRRLDSKLYEVRSAISDKRIARVIFTVIN